MYPVFPIEAAAGAWEMLCCFFALVTTVVSYALATR